MASLESQRRKRAAKMAKKAGQGKAGRAGKSPNDAPTVLDEEKEARATVLSMLEKSIDLAKRHVEDGGENGELVLHQMIYSEQPIKEGIEERRGQAGETTALRTTAWAMIEYFVQITEILCKGKGEAGERFFNDLTELGRGIKNDIEAAIGNRESLERFLDRLTDLKRDLQPTIEAVFRRREAAQPFNNNITEPQRRVKNEIEVAQDKIEADEGLTHRMPELNQRLQEEIEAANGKGKAGNQFINEVTEQLRQRFKNDIEAGEPSTGAPTLPQRTPTPAAEPSDAQSDPEHPAPSDLAVPNFAGEQYLAVLEKVWDNDPTVTEQPHTTAAESQNVPSKPRYPPPVKGTSSFHESTNKPPNNTSAAPGRPKTGTKGVLKTGGGEPGEAIKPPTDVPALPKQAHMAAAVGSSSQSQSDKVALFTHAPARPGRLDRRLDNDTKTIKRRSKEPRGPSYTASSKGKWRKFSPASGSALHPLTFEPFSHRPDIVATAVAYAKEISQKSEAEISAEDVHFLDYICWLDTLASQGGREPWLVAPGRLSSLLLEYSELGVFPRHCTATPSREKTRANVEMWKSLWEGSHTRQDSHFTAKVPKVDTGETIPTVDLEQTIPTASQGNGSYSVQAIPPYRAPPAAPTQLPSANGARSSPGHHCETLSALFEPTAVQHQEGPPDPMD